MEDFIREVSEHEEIDYQEKEDCIKVIARTDECIGEAGVYRLEWLKLQLNKGEYQGLEIVNSTDLYLLVCEINFAKILSDHVQNHLPSKEP